MAETKKGEKPAQGESKYGRKARTPIEATHDRHTPPVATCPKCRL